MKRFWDHAAAVALDDGWTVELDGRPVRIPDGALLRVASAPLTEAIAREWQAAGGEKGGEMSYADLPLTRLAGTAQQRIAPDPEPVILELAKYGGSDLLCYRAEHPPELIHRQEQAWQPWLDWADGALGARLRATAGVMHVAQDPAALAALAAAVATFDPLALSALGVAVPALGSLVLGLAMAHGALDAAEAHRLAMIDEEFQAEQWGAVDDAEERRDRVAGEIAVAGRMLDLVRDGGRRGRAADEGSADGA